MHYLAVSIDVFHAIVMMLWIFGLPLLFWHKIPKLTMSYAAFAIVFIIVNQVSHYTLGECIFTTLARKCFELADPHHPSTKEWFTVKFANFIFGFTPKHKSIKIISEILIAISAIGMFFSFIKNYKRSLKLSEQ